MKKTWFYLLLFVIILSLSYVIYHRYASQMEVEQIAEESVEEEVGMIDFLVYDASGNPVKLSDFEKPRVVNFWASWCPNCVDELPDFEEVCKEYKDQIDFLFVDLTDGVQETKESGLSFLAENKLVLPVYFDTDMDAAINYGIRAIPMTLLLDKEGIVVAYARGAIGKDVLQKAIEEYLIP